MKKVLAILLVLVVAMTGVMAEEPISTEQSQSSIVLQSNINQKVPVWTVFYGTDNTGADITEGQTYVADLTGDSSESGAIDSLSLAFGYTANVKKTYRSAYKIDITATSFTALDSDSFVVVNLQLGSDKSGDGKQTSTKADVAQVAVEGTYNYGNINKRVVDYVNVTWSQDSALAAGNYSSTVTVAFTQV